MKTITFILFLHVTLIFKGQITYTSNCTPHDTVSKFYSEDAKKLNMRHIYRANLTDKDSGALNRIITNSYLRALIAVYNATTMPARDSVVNLYKCHAYNPGLHTLLLMADSNMQWVKNFKHDIFPTGQSSLDSIMNKHYLKKFIYSAFLTSTVTLVFTSDTSFNAPALGRFLIHLPNVYQWDYDYYLGEGTDIEDTVNSTFHWFRFKYGWGDCSTGCRYHKYWEFKVFNDCSVLYLGTYGDPLYVGIKSSETTFEDVKVFPNPVSDKLNFNVSSSNTTRIAIYNSLGETMYRDKIQSSVDLNTFPPGIYFLELSRDHYKKVIKIIKE